MEPIFNMFKIRYNLLDDLIMKHCKEIQQDSKINLFINMEPILRKLSTANVDEYLKVRTEDKVYELISNIINMAAHYRLFFTKNRLYSKIYLFMGYPFTSAYKNRAINPKYRKAYEHKFTKDPKSMVLSNSLENIIPFTKIILEYVEGVYLLESGLIEPSLIPYIITKDSPSKTINFMVSIDRYDYQYTHHNFYILRPKKLESYIVSKNNVIDVMKAEDKLATEITVGANFVPFILSLLGDRYRGIEKIRRIGLAGILKMLNLAISENIISKDLTNINILSEVIKDEYRAQALSNFYCIDIETQFQMLNLKDLYFITDQLIDKFDNVALRNINDNYFQSHPIYLLELLSATKLLATRGRSVFGNV